MKYTKMYNVLNIKEGDSLFTEQFKVAGPLHGKFPPQWDSETQVLSILWLHHSLWLVGREGAVELVGAYQFLQSLVQKGHISLLLILCLPTRSHSHIELQRKLRNTVWPCVQKERT